MPQDHDHQPVADRGPTHRPTDAPGPRRPDRSPPRDLEIEVRNLEQGQVIEMDVRGAGSEHELEERLLRFVSVRQPAVLQLQLEAGRWQDQPRLDRARSAIEAFGGTLTITSTLVRHGIDDPDGGPAQPVEPV